MRGGVKYGSKAKESQNEPSRQRVLDFYSIDIYWPNGFSNHTLRIIDLGCVSAKWVSIMKLLLWLIFFSFNLAWYFSHGYSINLFTAGFCFYPLLDKIADVVVDWIHNV